MIHPMLPDEKLAEKFEIWTMGLPLNGTVSIPEGLDDAEAAFHRVMVKKRAQYPVCKFEGCGFYMSWENDLVHVHPQESEGLWRCSIRDRSGGWRDIVREIVDGQHFLSKCLLLTPYLVWCVDGRRSGFSKKLDSPLSANEMTYHIVEEFKAVEAIASADSGV